jgi:hypothetical protein
MPKLEEVLLDKLCYGGGETSVDIEEEVSNID